MKPVEKFTIFQVLQLITLQRHKTSIINPSQHAYRTIDIDVYLFISQYVKCIKNGESYCYAYASVVVALDLKCQ